MCYVKKICERLLGCVKCVEILTFLAPSASSPPPSVQWFAGPKNKRSTVPDFQLSPWLYLELSKSNEVQTWTMTLSHMGLYDPEK